MMPNRQLGKYTILEELGRGGFGTVYRATDNSLDREVALKILHPQLMVDMDFVERFQKEAKLVARLEHPNIVTIYDLGEAEGRIYIAMRYLPGGSLRDRLKKSGRIPFDRALEILRQVGEGLSAAHAKGLVHRDIKPENILFSESGQAVIADFGLARAVQTSSSSSLGGVGTPGYRPPELWRGQPPASPASDEYSLACAFVEMLTGAPLFAGDTPDEIIAKILVDGAVLPQNWPEGVPQGIDDILHKAVAKNPSERYTSVDDFVVALNRLKSDPARQEQELVLKEAQEKARQEELARQKSLVDEKARRKAEERIQQEVKNKERQEAEAQTRQEMQAQKKKAVEQRSAEIVRLQNEIELALTEEKWKKARKLIYQMKRFGPEGQVLSEHLRKYLPKRKISVRVWASLAALVIIMLLAPWMNGIPVLMQMQITHTTETPTSLEITRQPINKTPIGTLQILESITVPEDDLATLACRFRKICNIPPTLPAPSAPLTAGARQTFWVNETKVQATLRYVTSHSYFWIEDGVRYNQQDVKNLMDAFENKIYPTDRQFFGSEWTPGVDDDPHIYILYTNALGDTAGVAYSSIDEYPPQINPYSNAHELLSVSSTEPLTDLYTYSSLAHGFQYMIDWYKDPNEPTYLNEGFSELAEFINGYPSGGNEQVFITNPDINLTDWISGAPAQDRAHFGASFLFATYFLDRFGADTTKAFFQNKLNGLDKIDNTLAQRNLTDPATGKIITADDFFLDWVIANYVHDSSVSDGRYFYHNYPAAPKANPTETISNCPADPASRTVNQYGADYIQITCPGSHTGHFAGATSTRLMPADPHSGSYTFWSNAGNQSDMTLNHQFDLSGVSGPVSMSYWTWYDIEKDYDYVYVEASSDGEHWIILTTPSGTSINPNGGSYGWAYTGQSNGWIHESVDLSQFAGKKVSVRFEYLTDPAANGAGFLLDDVSVPAIHYSTSFEIDDNSWVADGFARIENTIPQTFRLAMITHGANGTSVKVIPVAADQSADIPLTIGQNGAKDIVLVVTGTTRFTRELAPYQFSIR